MEGGGGGGGTSLIGGRPGVRVRSKMRDKRAGVGRGGSGGWKVGLMCCKGVRVRGGVIVLVVRRLC